MGVAGLGPVRDGPRSRRRRRARRASVRRRVLRRCRAVAVPSGRASASWRGIGTVARAAEPVLGARRRARRAVAFAGGGSPPARGSEPAARCSARVAASWAASMRSCRPRRTVLPVGQPALRVLEQIVVVGPGLAVQVGALAGEFGTAALGAVGGVEAAEFLAQLALAAVESWSAPASARDGGSRPLARVPAALAAPVLAVGVLAQPERGADQLRLAGPLQQVPEPGRARAGAASSVSGSAAARRRAAAAARPVRARRQARAGRGLHGSSPRTARSRRCRGAPGRRRGRRPPTAGRASARPGPPAGGRERASPGRGCPPPGPSGGRWRAAARRPPVTCCSAARRSSASRSSTAANRRVSKSRPSSLPRASASARRKRAKSPCGSSTTWQNWSRLMPSELGDLLADLLVGAAQGLPLAGSGVVLAQPALRLLRGEAGAALLRARLRGAPGDLQPASADGQFEARPRWRCRPAAWSLRSDVPGLCRAPGTAPYSA